MLSDGEVDRLRTAAEEASWLCARGYPALEVARFIAEHRGLSPRERILLDAIARADAHHRHHIARELDPDDVTGRPLRLDVASVCANVATSIAATFDPRIVLFESAAGLIGAAEVAHEVLAVHEPEALRRIAEVVLTLGPSAVRIVHDAASLEHADALRKLLSGKRKPTVVCEEVASVAARLRAAAFVASASPEVLDHCGTWFNLAGILAKALGVTPLRLG